jgi:hypothetical protein
MDNNRSINNMFRSEHGRLISTAEILVNDLKNCVNSIAPLGDVEYMHHNQLAERTLELALHLNAVLALAENQYYSSAFALLRTSLEHQVFDRLLFLADRFEEELSGIDEPTWQKWQLQKPNNVVTWERKGRDKVKVTWLGPRVHKEGDEEHDYNLSIYYHYLDVYDPFVISGEDLADISAGHPMQKEQNTIYAREQLQLWHRVLSWSNLTKNLLLNRISSEQENLQLEIHYRFLSVFSHPVSNKTWTSIYGYNHTLEVPRYDHYASELCLLYITYIAISELRNFLSMCARPPKVSFQNLEKTKEHIKQSEQVIFYFWPPGGEPHYYDRVKEANQRYFDAYPQKTQQAVIDPKTLENNEIRYYSNPL